MCKFTYIAVIRENLVVTNIKIGPIAGRSADLTHWARKMRQSAYVHLCVSIYSMYVYILVNVMILRTEGPGKFVD